MNEQEQTQKIIEHLELLRAIKKNGAPEEILYDSKPHIGTDILSKVVISMREYIKKNGGEIHYRTKLFRCLRCSVI